jgi:multiple sugar transport system substrate-binding protein
MMKKGEKMSQKKTSTKKWIAIIVAILIVIAIAGYVYTIVMAPKRPQMVTIRMIYWPGPESESWTPVLDSYNKEQAPKTGIKVEMVTFSREEFWVKEDTVLAAKSPDFDIITAGIYNVAHYAPYLIPIDDLKDELLKLGYLKVHLDGLTVNGHLYCVPTLGLNNHALFYRKDLIDDLLHDPAKIDLFKKLSKQYLGKELTPKPPEEWDWDDYIATAIFFTQKYNPDSPTKYGTAVYGKRGMMDTPWHLMDIAWSFGGRWFKAGTYEPDFTSEAWKKAINIYATLRNLGAFPPDVYDWDYMAVDNGLKSGLIAFAIHFSIAWAGLNDPKQTPYAGKFGMTHTPGARNPDGSLNITTYVNPVGLCISKYSRHPDEAKKFLLIMSSEEMQTAYVEHGGVPLVKPVLEKLAQQRPDWAIDLEIIDKYGYTLPAIPESIDILVAMSEDISAVLAGIEDPGTALQNINNKVHNIMERAGYYKK